MKTILIIPAYNEQDNILSTCRKIEKYNEENGTSYDYIVINDGSTDSTGKICRENGLPAVELIRNLGIGGAVQTGYKYAYEHGYDIAIQYDGDGQHDISYVDEITAPIQSGEADFAIGSRFVCDDRNNFRSTLMRRVGIKLISFNIKLTTGAKIFDTTSGFRACGREIMKLFADNYPTEYPEPITNAAVLKKGFRVKEIPVKMNEREGGVSSIRAWKTVYYMINVNLTILLNGIGGMKK